MWNSQQFLFMKINFDLLQEQNPTPTSPPKNRPIKVEIESPVYQKIYKSISPHNYRNELESMTHLISIPKPISHFIAQQIDKQIQVQTHNTSLETEPNQVHTQDTQLVNPTPKKKIQVQEKPKKQKNKMNWVYKYKKHQCQSEFTSSIKKQASELSQLTLKPKLYPSKTAKKIGEGRKSNNILGHKFSVYDNLYKDAAKQDFKKAAAKKMEVQKGQSRTPKINHKYFAEKKKVYVPIFNRLDDILERKQKIRIEGDNYDLTTGRELFQPDLNSSKDSYRMYFQSLSKEKIKSKRGQQKTIEQNLPNKKRKAQQKNLEDTLDGKTIKFFSDLFYPELEDGTQIVKALNSIKQKQFIVLQPFLHQIEELESRNYEQETNVSRIRASSKPESVFSKGTFQEHFYKYYSGLTLHDRQILRSEVLKRKREHIRIYEDAEVEMTFRPSINIRSSSLDSLAKGHSHKIYFV